MKVAILSAILGNFDKPVDPVEQELPEGVTEIAFHRFTDENFPPITGMTPRMQYRLCKMFGWEMFQGYDIYIWLDGSVSLQRPDCVKWYLEQLGDADAAFFRHPQRNTILDEAVHIDDKLRQNHWYITPRYKNGLHFEQVQVANNDSTFKDTVLYTSTAFVYRNNEKGRELMKVWWYYQTRYYTCDQVNLPYAIHKSGAVVNRIPDNQYKIGYLSLVSHHK